MVWGLEVARLAVPAVAAFGGAFAAARWNRNRERQARHEGERRDWRDRLTPVLADMRVQAARADAVEPDYQFPLIEATLSHPDVEVREEAAELQRQLQRITRETLRMYHPSRGGPGAEGYEQSWIAREKVRGEAQEALDELAHRLRGAT